MKFSEFLNERRLRDTSAYWDVQVQMMPHGYQLVGFFTPPPKKPLPVRTQVLQFLNSEFGIRDAEVVEDLFVSIEDGKYAGDYDIDINNKLGRIILAAG